MHKQKWKACWMICHNMLSQLFHTIIVSAWHTYEFVKRSTFLSSKMPPLTVMCGSTFYCLYGLEFGKNLLSYLFPSGVYRMCRWEKRAPPHSCLTEGTEKWSVRETAINKGLQHPRSPYGLRMELELRSRAHRDLKRRSRQWRGRVQSIHAQRPGCQECLLMSHLSRPGSVMVM